MISFHSLVASIVYATALSEEIVASKILYALYVYPVFAPSTVIVAAIALVQAASTRTSASRVAKTFFMKVASLSVPFVVPPWGAAQPVGGRGCPGSALRRIRTPWAEGRLSSFPPFAFAPPAEPAYQAGRHHQQPAEHVNQCAAPARLR